MRRLTILGVLLLVLSACGESGDRARTSERPPDAAGQTAAELAVPLSDGTELRYLLHAPPTVDGGGPMPLVLVFHGNPGTPETMVHATRSDRLADRQGFLVVYPDNYSGPDEVPVLLDHLAESWQIDRQRIYAAGFSRGATAVYDLARSQSARIAAFAPVSGISDSGFELHRVPSLIAFQGTADDLAPGFAPLNRKWSGAAGCRDASVAAVRLGGRAARRSTAACAGGAEHVVYTVERIGHTWPRAASRLIWEFFLRHPLDGR